MAKPYVPYEGPIVSREDAIKLGLTRFFDGKPCKYGHVDQRHVSNRDCKVCSDERSRVRQREKPEAVRAAIDRHRMANLELMRARDRERHRREYIVDPEVHLTRNRRNKRIRYEVKAGRPKPSVCEICRGNGGHHGICFDHCHATGKFRGWICDRCNKVLGLVGDEAELLRKMVEYLERANGRTVSKAKTEPPQKQLCASRQREGAEGSGSGQLSNPG